MESEGRLEICSSRSVWGTVCNRQWTDANSKVACYALGFDFTKGKYFENRAFSFKNPSAGSYQTYDTFDRIPATITIAVDYIRCLGSEYTMSRCTYISHSFSGCSHDHDIGLTCQPGKLPKKTQHLILLLAISFTANCDDGDVRLSNGRDGYVFTCIKNRWGPLCYPHGDFSAALINSKTVCSQLGYTGGK